MSLPTILFSTTYVGYPFLRQLPEQPTPWNRFAFTTDPSHPNLFGCVVYDDFPETLRLRIPRSHTFLVTGEPPSLRTYRPRYTHQFGAVRTSHSHLQHPNRTVDHEGQPWYYGMYESQSHGAIATFDTLAELPYPAKPKRISVIASNKTTTPDHRERLRFVESLKAAFPNQIDVFGRGIRTVQDKADAIYPYEYHIVLENDHSSHYVSEKLTDSYLGWAYPFYSGSLNADRLMPESSFLRIDMHAPEKSIALIEKAMEENIASKNRMQLAAARSIVLNEMNLFAIVQNHFHRLGPHSTRTSRCTLFPKHQAAKQIFNRALRSLHLGT